MKLHRSLVKAVIDTLHQIMEEGRYADHAVACTLQQNPKWGARDRRFIAETVYDIVRWWRLFNAVLPAREDNSPLDYYHIIAVYCILKGFDLPDWPELSGVDKNKVLQNAENVKHIRKYRESVPDWLDELGARELGESVWTNELSELNKEARVVLRVNTIKTTRIQLQRILLEQGMETTIIGDYEDALVLNKRYQLHHLAAYKLGLFEIQDASSQLIASFLQAEQGMLVVDACAGAGGKSLHLAAILKNTGRIVSLDVEAHKLAELKKRAGRAGANNIETRMIGTGTIHQLKDTADRLLLDVPCSGLGVLKRNADAKWKLDLNFIDKIKKIQQEVITGYSSMLKPGGIMVYATCSILPSENQEQVERFLKMNKDFEFMEDRKILPSEGFDGFYMARIKRVA